MGVSLLRSDANHFFKFATGAEPASYSWAFLNEDMEGETVKAAGAIWSEPLRLDTLSLNTPCVPESHSLPVASHIPLEADTLKRNVTFSYYTHLK